MINKVWHDFGILVGVITVLWCMVNATRHHETLRVVVMGLVMIGVLSALTYPRDQ